MTFTLRTIVRPALNLRRRHDTREQREAMLDCVVEQIAARDRALHEMRRRRAGGWAARSTLTRSPGPPQRARASQFSRT